MATTEQGRALRSRRAAQRHGLTLRKNRARKDDGDRRYTYTLHDANGDAVTGADTVTLDVIETFLDSQEPYRRVEKRRALANA